MQSEKANAPSSESREPLWNVNDESLLQDLKHALEMISMDEGSEID
jgi:hypothetical protein